MSSYLGHTARKRFGQNFLINEGIINKIIKAVAPNSDHKLVEIGPGLGALTLPILESISHLTVIELDKDLANRFATGKYQDKLTIYQTDALKFDFNSIYTGDKKLKVFGNLPYNISTPILFHLFKFAPIIYNMHFMLQKEVALRISAAPGSKIYGRLSVMAQYFCQIVPVLEVPPSSFTPAPKVDSAVIRLIPYVENPNPCLDVELLKNVCSMGFKMRRKTLRNNFKQVLTDEEFEHLSIDPNSRPEQLSVANFVEITNYLYTKKVENINRG